MLTNEREEKICAKFSARDENGLVHCYECPLLKGNPNRWDFRCKANSHYDRHEGEWIPDYWGEPFNEIVINTTKEATDRLPMEVRSDGNLGIRRSNKKHT